jgi:hypothetical protein
MAKVVGRVWVIHAVASFSVALLGAGCANSAVSGSTASGSVIQFDPNPEVEAALLQSERRAFQHKFANCLRRNGVLAQSFEFQEFSELSRNIDNEDFKRTFGYGVSAANDIAEATQATDVAVAANPVFSGPESFQEACAEEAIVGYPRLERNQQILKLNQEGFYDSFYDMVEASLAMQKIRGQWRQCVGEKQVTGDNPWKVRDGFGAALGQLKMQREEAETLPAVARVKQLKAIQLKLADLRRREFATAAIDADCSEPIAQQRDAIWLSFENGGLVDDGN